MTVAWVLAVLLTVFGWPGGILLPVGCLIARATARRPRPESKNQWGVLAPTTDKERGEEASWRRAGRMLTRDLLPTGPDACIGILIGAAAAIPVAWWAWPLQTVGVYLWMMGWLANRRDMTLKPESLDWGMIRRRVPWAKKHRTRIILLAGAGFLVGIPFDIILTSISPSIMIAALLAPVPMRPAIRANRESFDRDMKATRFIHSWLDSMSKPPVPAPPGRIHDTREAADGSLLFLMDVPDASDWVKDPVMNAFNPCAQRDSMRVGFVFDGDRRTRVSVAITPTDITSSPVADGVMLAARLTVDEMRVGFLYGALPGRIIRLKIVGRRNGRPAVWSFRVDGSNADWATINRDWLKGSTQGRFGDWGSLDGLHIIADLSADHGWVTDDTDWTTVEWDMEAIGPLMGVKPTRDHTDPGRYFDLIAMEKHELTVWEGALADAKGLTPPSTIDFDSRRTLTASDGWRLEVTRMLLPRGSNVASYMTVDLKPGFAEAYVADILPLYDRTGWHDRQFEFVHAPRVNAPWNVGMPILLRDIEGDGEAERLLARVLASRACATVLPTPPRIGPAVQVAARGSGWSMWRMPVELAGGVTGDRVNRVAERLKSMMGVDRLILQWADAGRVVIWAGVDPPDDPAGYRNPRDHERLMRLILDDAWSKSGARGADGSPPRTIQVGHEGAMLRATFRLPAGLGTDGALRKLDAFKASSGYSYARRIPTADGGITLLLSKGNPLPESIRTDWTLMVNRGSDIPFATGDDGNPVTFDPHDTAHLLITGMTMSGKSSAAVTLVCGMLLNHWMVMVADPVKHAADFTSIRSKLHGFADGLNDTAALLKWLVAENQRRLTLQREHGVENHDGLPDDIRPPRICLFADEFNSTLGSGPAQIPNPDGDPDIANRNLTVQWENNLRRSIGVSVGELLTQARSQGITILLGAQKLNAADLNDLPNGAKDQMGRLFIGSGNPAGNVSQMNIQEANRLIEQALSTGGMPKGRGLYERMGRGVSMVQCWWSGKGGELTAALNHLPDAEKVDYSPFLEDPPRLVGAVAPGMGGQANDADSAVESVDDVDWDDGSLWEGIA